MIATTTAQITAGSVVLATPYANGNADRATRGIVLSTGTTTVVWFPSRGALHVRGAVQAYSASELGDATSITEQAPSWIVRVERAARQSRKAGAWMPDWNDAGWALERARKAL